MSDKKTLYRIYIQPQSQIENQPSLEDMMNKHGEFAKDKGYHLSTIDLTITNIANEDNKNQFLYDLLMTCLTINRKLKNEWDMVLFFIKGIPKSKGVATGWASVISFKELILFSKIFKSGYEVNFLFDLPQKTHPNQCKSMEDNFKEILKDDYYLKDHELERLKKPILTKSGIRTNKLNKIEKYLDKLNSKNYPDSNVNFYFYYGKNEPLDFPYTSGLFDEDESSLSVNFNNYQLKEY